jgi:MFS family permease
MILVSSCTPTRRFNRTPITDKDAFVRVISLLASQLDTRRPARALELGLRANWRQFALLVAVNAFVGAMVGLERAVLPIVATDEFHIASTTAVLSFIASFGLVKAGANLAAGWLADRYNRRSVLLLGWGIGLPIPALILWAPSWSWIVAANVLLGANQGLTWSSTIIMKIDLVGPRRRGLAMGLNEFAGYVAVAVAALMSGFLATRYGMRNGVGYAASFVAVAGLLLSFFVRETEAHAALEARSSRTPPPEKSMRTVLRRSMWQDRSLFSLSQAGLVNNLNDGLAWGVFPLLFARAGLSLRETALLAAVYPGMWGVSQLVTGALSDLWGRKRFIVAGMLLQAAALVAVALTHSFGPWLGALAMLGIGTALVYPTLLAAVNDVSHPQARGVAVGVYRLWRDLGYVAGALSAGVLTDLFSISSAINSVAALTAISGVLVAVHLREKG